MRKLFFFRIGTRLAMLPAASGGVAAGLLLWYVGSSNSAILLGTLVTVFLVGGASCIANYLILHSRLKSLNETIATTSRQHVQTSPYQQFKTDELDHIIRNAELTRRSIQNEFNRMDQIENYRKEFIGDISHELKTPIFTVQGYLETLYDGALEDPKVNREFLKKAMNNVDRLTFLTKDLMEISRLETGELKPDFQMIPINTIIDDVIESLQYKADQNQIRFRFHPRSTNLFAYADRNQIRQVLINLMDNALKYNKPGGEVHIETELSSKHTEKLLISIRDTGIGISKKHLNRVTERFYRVDKSRSREQGGTGLGLSIVKHILESHREELYMESAPGQGSVFRFTLQNADHR